MVLSPNKKIEFKGAPALNIIGIGQNEKKNDHSGSQEPQSKEIGGNGGYISVTNYVRFILRLGQGQIIQKTNRQIPPTF